VRQRLVLRGLSGPPAPAHISAALLQGPDGPCLCLVATDLSELENSTEIIGQLRRTEADLRGSRDYLDSIINAVADPLYVNDSLHRFLLVNASFCRLLGKRPAELIGKATADFLPPRPSAALMDQDDCVLRTGKEDGIEVCIRNAAGGERIFESVKTPHTNEAGQRLVVCCLRDVTEAKAGERVALRARQEWERTFNAVPDLVAVLDDKHRIRRVNKALAERLGLSPEALAGRNCHEVIHGGAHPAGSCPHAFTCADGREHFVEFHEERLGGDFRISTTPILDERGQVSGSVHVARDITESKKAEAVLKAAAKLREDLISLINHEYANGLTNLRLATALLRCTEPGTPDETRTHSYDVLERTVALLKSYTANFLNLHRIELGSFELALAPISILKVLNESLVTLQPLAEAKKQSLSLQTSFPEDMPVAVRADADCISLIINNLVTNAVKYTPEGGAITIRLSLLEGPPAQVRFSIEDTGIGVSPQDQQRILTGYYRTKEGKDVAKGFGVGLMLVRKLLEQHASRLEIESEPGKGSRFSFCLPVWAEEAAAKAPLSAHSFG